MYTRDDLNQNWKYPEKWIILIRPLRRILKDDRHPCQERKIKLKNKFIIAKWKRIRIVLRRIKVFKCKQNVVTTVVNVCHASLSLFLMHLITTLYMCEWAAHWLETYKLYSWVKWIWNACFWADKLNTIAHSSISVSGLGQFHFLLLLLTIIIDEIFEQNVDNRKLIQNDDIIQYV